MPTYEYKCGKCGKFEEFQSITAKPLEKCPVCGEPVVRLVGRNVSILFKGSGFYSTDYGTNGRRQQSGTAGKGAKASTQS